MSLDDLGAWLLKANGVTSDITEVAARGEAVRTWCVRPGYRTRLMAAGQPVLLWVSGDRRRLAPGVWGVGELSGPPMVSDGKLRVPLELRWLDEDQRVHRDIVRADEGLAALEVLRQPQGSNPSFVTAAQMAVLRRHLPLGCGHVDQ
ncbi:hypothetical protein CLV67_120102 [Actinoplanes italicus]|uniref:EVE domain-containing protein n=1 Tax=Actinoplanes italicus TaxID=113567 RepID=A0A2T0K0H9_9ACTN|nr:hypothetical protein CLV67_120102 [Actinoplanes italicus]